VAVDPSGEYAASSALDSFIRVWNLADASTKAVMETPPSETWQLAWHPTADKLTLAAAGGSAHSIAVWDCESAKITQTLEVPWVSIFSWMFLTPPGGGGKLACAPTVSEIG